MIGLVRLALVCQLLITTVVCRDNPRGRGLADDGTEDIDGLRDSYNGKNALISKPSGTVDRGLQEGPGAVKTYLLYTIPPFIAHMSFRAGTGDVSEYQAISHTIADVTTDFLTTYFLSDLNVRTEYEGSSAQFHSIELDVAVRRGVTKRGSRSLTRTRVLQTAENTIEIRSEFTGEAIFSDLSFVTQQGTATVTQENYGRFRVNQDVVRSIVTAAFSDNTQASPYLRRLQRSSNDLLSAILSVDVQTNTDRRTGSSNPGTSVGNDGSASASSASNNNGDDQGHNDRMSRGEGLAILFMGTFLLFFFAGFYIYLSREHHSQMKLERAYARHYGRRSRMNSKQRQLSADTLAMDETDSYEDEFEVDIEEGSPRKERGPVFMADGADCNNDAKASHQPSQSLKIMDIIAASSSPDMKDPAVAAYYDQLSETEVVPIPARADELSLSSFPSSAGRKRSGANMDQHPVSRRYVHAASPFDVLYGAAFLHQDQERVEKTYASMSRRGHRSNSNSNGGGTRHTRSHNRKKKSAPKKCITPMSSIAETEEEFAGSGVPPVEPIPSIDSSNAIDHISGDAAMLPDTRAAAAAPPPPLAQGGSTSASVLPMYSPTALLKSLSSYFDGTSSNIAPAATSSPKGVDEMVVYRDFPRHDGTPCLMYTARDSSSSATKGSNDFAQSREPEFDPIYTGAPTKRGFAGVQTVNLEGGGSYLEFNAGYSSAISSHGALLETENEDDNKSYGSNASSNASSLVAGIDTFVDKLERLMEVRSQQYQDRVKADRDRAANRLNGVASTTLTDCDTPLSNEDTEVHEQLYETSLEDVTTALVPKDVADQEAARSVGMKNPLEEESMTRTDEQVGIMS